MLLLLQAYGFTPVPPPVVLSNGPAMGHVEPVPIDWEDDELMLILAALISHG